MVVKFEKGFGYQALNLPKSTQKKVKTLIQNITNASTIDSFKPKSIHGFPYLFTIEIDSYYVGYQIINNEIVFIGIVTHDKIFSMFF
ncbi:MAG: hypothetical protein EAZ53_12180 [Bacteroidetes bacterium]|nr:MAG: hypothetical protein EAZ53_12180 [Bacteroidota bacterium]